MTWNTMVHFSPSQVLAASDLENNFDNVSLLYSFMPFYCDGRLTLTSGTPVTTANVTAASTLYFTPFNGNRISLYDGTSAWTLNSFSETSLSLSGLIKGTLYDILGYLSGGTFTLEAVAWKKVTATNSPTSGSSKTINISDTSTLAVGMEVSVKDGSNSEVAVITAVVANTSITVASLASSYTLPDIYGFQTRATALTTQNGVYVKSGATARRYLGTIRITTTTGQTEDSLSRRYVWNLYNRERRALYCYDATDLWSYTLAAYQPANGNTTPGTGRFGFVQGLELSPFHVENYQTVDNTSSGQTKIGVGINNTTTDNSHAGQWASGSGEKACSAIYEGYIGIGHYYIQRLEYSQAAGTTYWRGDNGGTPPGQSAGMIGWILG